MRRDDRRKKEESLWTCTRSHKRTCAYFRTHSVRCCYFLWPKREYSLFWWYSDIVPFGAMKFCMEIRGRAPRKLNFGSRWNWVVRYWLQPLFSWYLLNSRLVWSSGPVWTLKRMRKFPAFSCYPTPDRPVRCLVTSLYNGLCLLTTFFLVPSSNSGLVNMRPRGKYFWGLRSPE